MQPLIRPEMSGDIPAIYQVNQLAFKRENEAQLVNRLREENAVVLSLVAICEGRLVGHILFSPVTITNNEFQW